jgi:GNAT superfamily N-acetyltransferase
MTPAPEIRPLSPADTTAAVALLEFLNPECTATVLRERYETMLREHSHYQVIGAFVDARLVGLTGVWTATKIWCGRYLEIDNLVVHPDHRSSGIGAVLIGHIGDLAKRQGCHCMTLDAYVANHASHRLYHRQGFEIWGFHFVKPIGDIHA